MVADFGFVSLALGVFRSLRCAILGHGAWSMEFKTRGQRSEVRSQKSDHRCQQAADCFLPGELCLTARGERATGENRDLSKKAQSINVAPDWRDAQPRSAR